MNEQKILEVEKVSFLYKDSPLLRNVSFSLKKGEIASLIGSSGSGKTTLFKLLTGVLMPKQGRIKIDNLSLPAGHGKVAYMMQEDLLLPWRTVLNNMTLSAELGDKQHSKKALELEALDLLNDIGLNGCASMFPHQLSGGMRQRVSLARALMHKRPLLLLDEPFGSLDVSLRGQMYALLKLIRDKYHTTILLITHDFRDALSLSDHIFLLSDQHICKEWHMTDNIRQDPYASTSIFKEMQTAII